MAGCHLVIRKRRNFRAKENLRKHINILATGSGLHELFSQSHASGEELIEYEEKMKARKKATLVKRSPACFSSLYLSSGSYFLFA